MVVVMIVVMGALIMGAALIMGDRVIKEIHRGEAIHLMTTPLARAGTPVAALAKVRITLATIHPDKAVSNRLNKPHRQRKRQKRPL